MVAEPVDTHAATPVITIPAQVTLILDQLLDALRQLDEPGRARVAKALKEAELDARWEVLDRHMAERTLPDDVIEVELGQLVNEEIKAYRREKAELRHTPHGS